MKHRERYPSITVRRAFALLRQLDQHGNNPPLWLVNEAKTMLENHVLHGLSQGRRSRYLLEKAKRKR